MSRRGKTGSPPPQDDDVLYLDADDEKSQESLEEILKEAQASAERRSAAEKTASEGAAPAAAKSAKPHDGEGEEQEEIIEYVDDESAPEGVAAAPVAVPPARLHALEEENEKLQSEVVELKDALMRKQAEFENFRKRMSRDKEEFQRYAVGTLLKEILPVLDNLERALMVAPGADTGSLRQGVELIQKQLRDTLARFGLKEVMAIGQEFDPNFHEAVASEPSDLKPNTVISELQRGYLHHDRLLRAACVKVAAPAPEGSGGNGAES